MNTPLHQKISPSLPTNNTRALSLIVISVTFWLFLSSITAFASYMLSSQWMRESLPIVTIQVPDGDLPVSPGNVQTRSQSVMSHLSILPTDTKIHRLTDNEVDKLLEPLLGRTQHDALPLPAIIRIKLAPGTTYPAQLDTELAQAVPGTLTERGTFWERQLQHLASQLLFYTKLAFLPVGFFATFTLITATYLSLGTLTTSLSRMHFLGASSGWLIRRLSFRNGLTGFYSALIGCFLAALPLFIFAKRTMARAEQPTSLLHISNFMSALHNHYHPFLRGLLAIFIAITLAATIVCTLSTSLVIRHRLRKLP